MGYESVINNEDSHFEEGILSVRGASVKTINGCWVSLDLSMLLSQLNVAYIFFLFTCCACVCTVNLQVVLIWGNKGEFKTYLHEHPFSILSVSNLVKRAQMKKNRNVMLYEIAEQFCPGTWITGGRRLWIKLRSLNRATWLPAKRRRNVKHLKWQTQHKSEWYI